MNVDESLSSGAEPVPSDTTHHEFDDARAKDLVLDAQELDEGVLVDVPAFRYEEVLDLVGYVERRTHDIGSGLHITIGRKEDIIVLRATSDHVADREILRSIMGLAS